MDDAIPPRHLYLNTSPQELFVEIFGGVKKAKPDHMVEERYQPCRMSRLKRCLAHEAPIARHRSGDLGQCRLRPFEQVECATAENRIQGIVQEGKAEGAPTDKKDILKPSANGFLSSLAKHRQGKIEADHPTRSLCSQRARKQSRATCQIQDTTPLLRFQPSDQIRRELSKGRRAGHKEAKRSPILFINCCDRRELHQALEGRDDLPVGAGQEVQDAIP